MGRSDVTPGGQHPVRISRHRVRGTSPNGDAAQPSPAFDYRSMTERRWPIARVVAWEHSMRSMGWVQPHHPVEQCLSKAGHAPFSWSSSLSGSRTLSAISCAASDCTPGMTWLYNSEFRFDDQLLVTPHLYRTPGSRRCCCTCAGVAPMASSTTTWPLGTWLDGRLAARGVVGRYDVLGAHLNARGGKTITMDFEEVDAVVGGLPESARTHRPSLATAAASRGDSTLTRQPARSHACGDHVVEPADRRRPPMSRQPR